MFNFVRRNHLIQTQNLFENDINNIDVTYEEKSEQDLHKHIPSSHIAKLLFQADINISAKTLILIAIASGIAFTALLSKIIAAYLLPIIFLIGVSVPFFWVEGKIRKRTNLFSADYPAMLLATASSIKVGLTPYQALEKSIELLQNDSLVKKHVSILLDQIHQGINRENAIENFAIDIRLPDLSLFRSALKLVLENGGRFSPTLNRLATVSNNRTSLIRAAEVSTATMRMTGNILLLLAPFLLFMLSLRSDTFWTTLVNHPTANFLASLGSIIICLCYFILNRMSHFKP